MTTPKRDHRVREHFVYRCYNEAGELLYLGRTNNLARRWREHRTDRHWPWWEAVRFHVSGPYTFPVAHLMEYDALAAERPLYGWTPPLNARPRSLNRDEAAMVQAFYDQGLGFVDVMNRLEHHRSRSERGHIAPLFGALMAVAFALVFIALLFAGVNHIQDRFDNLTQNTGQWIGSAL